MVHIAPRYRKGLEPLIATIILIAITLVIAIAVVAWILGVFGGTVGDKEELQVFPNTSLTFQNTNWNLSMTVRNIGSVSAQIIGITVGNVTCSLSQSPFPIGSGEIKLVQAACSGNFAPGVSYTIRILTAAGNEFYGYVVAG